MKTTIQLNDNNWSGNISKLKVNLNLTKATATWKHNGYTWKATMALEVQDDYSKRKNEQWVTVVLEGCDWSEPLTTEVICVSNVAEKAQADIMCEAVKVAHSYIVNCV